MEDTNKIYWETIYSKNTPGQYTTTTKRAKVVGGWLVKFESYAFSSNRNEQGLTDIDRVSNGGLTFIPDKNNEWRI